jgi:hypothetical protein
MDIVGVLHLVDIFAVSLPVIIVSALLVLKTRAIRSHQKRYSIQMILFRDILLIGYLFIFAGFLFLAGDVSEMYDNELYEELSRVGFNVLLLVIVIAVTVSFYKYHNLMTGGTQQGQEASTAT